MSWTARLNLDYTQQDQRCVARFAHEGPLRLQARATQPHPQVIVLRVLAPVVEPVVEPAMQLLRPVWAAWRQALWGMPGTPLRLWNI